MKKNVLIFVVAYNAEKFIESVLERIPASLWADERFNVECLIIDDASPDKTFERAKQYSARRPELKITVMYNPINQGYGGNQKLGYLHAIQNGFDVVVMLHGDGQYAPEYLLQMIEPITNGEADVVLGSRMIDKKAALNGKMPMYKWLGNQVLTTLQNFMLGSKLAEFHTGYRAYSVPALNSVPFTSNADYFDFDTDILIQMISTKKRIKEISVPTFYGEEISHVNSWRYGLLILRSTLLAKLMPLGIYYHPKFDYDHTNSYYTAKFGFPSSHQFAIDRVKQSSTVLDLGCGPGFMAQKLSEKQVRTISLDRFILDNTKRYSYKTIEANVEDYTFDTDDTPVDTILLLDIIEHLKTPETLMSRIRERYSGERPEVIITTANIAFLPIRLSLLLGQFNYGKKGILDQDHARLFTFRTLRRMLRITGYDVIEERGIPVPFPLIVKNATLQQLLLNLNQLVIWWWNGLFAYQIAVRARPRPTVNFLLQTARTTGEKRWEERTIEAAEHERELVGQ
jgi:glycosyltransferase involved in cell wall biosynthesis